jgi:hypothetical protein
VVSFLCLWKLFAVRGLTVLAPKTISNPRQFDAWFRHVAASVRFVVDRVTLGGFLSEWAISVSLGQFCTHLSPLQRCVYDRCVITSSARN